MPALRAWSLSHWTTREVPAIHLKMYLFIFGHAGLLCGLFSRYGKLGRLCCDVWACHCSGFPCCGPRFLGPPGLQELQHVGLIVAVSGLQSTGSVVVAHRLSRSRVCGIFLDQGLSPCLLRCKVNYLPLSHQESPRAFFFFFQCSTLSVFSPA